MVKKTLTYNDYDGNPVTKDFYFNISKMEFRDLDRKIPGGLQNLIDRIQTEKDENRMLDLMSMLILASYGEKAEDGRFVKEDAYGRKLSSFFKVSEAWDVLFVNLLDNEDEMSEFLTGIVPKDIADEARIKMEEEKNNAAGQGHLTPVSGNVK